MPPRGRLGLYHFALLRPDRPSLGAFWRHLATLGERAGASDNAVSEALYLTDPDGLGIEVHADRPRSEWRVHERELHMDTRPLDAPGLARAARHTVWTGLPAGTVVGHVHLHVGDLSEADGYHHHLALNTWAAGATPASDDDARLLAWELVLPTVADVDAAAASLADAGHQVVREGSEVRANDPWNTTLRIVHRTADS